LEIFISSMDVIPVGAGIFAFGASLFLQNLIDTVIPWKTCGP
jgi:hypothetical protein